jgi:hypothetical protein
MSWLATLRELLWSTCERAIQELHIREGLFFLDAQRKFLKTKL